MSLASIPSSFLSSFGYVLRHKTGSEVCLVFFYILPFIFEFFTKFPQDKRLQLFLNNKRVSHTMELMIHESLLDLSWTIRLPFWNPNLNFPCKIVSRLHQRNVKYGSPEQNIQFSRSLPLFL